MSTRDETIPSKTLVLLDSDEDVTKQLDNALNNYDTDALQNKAYDYMCLPFCVPETVCWCVPMGAVYALEPLFTNETTSPNELSQINKNETTVCNHVNNKIHHCNDTCVHCLLDDLSKNQSKNDSFVHNLYRDNCIRLCQEIDQKWYKSLRYDQTPRIIDPHSVLIGATVSLTFEEALICIRLGKQRQEQNKNKTKHARFSPCRSQTDLDIQGVFGEYALSKLFALPFQVYDTQCRNYKQDTFDCTFYDKYTCDVKTMIGDNCPLILSKYKSDHCPDFYALMIYQNGDARCSIEEQVLVHNHLPRLMFRGFASASQLVKSSNLRLYGNQHYYFVLSQDKLCAWNQLEINITLNYYFF